MSNLDSGLASTVRSLLDNVLRPLKDAFVGKDEIIDLMGVCLLARENLFLLGPPGTAKSALVRALATQIEGRVFDYLLTRFTEPNELFGPFDIRKLREGDLVTNTEGMLPEADFVFLDELLNANSAILNSLLMALNERVFRRGRETRRLSTLMFVGASNRLPEEEALRALFDRFLLRVPCNYVDDSQLDILLKAGWSMEQRSSSTNPKISVESLAEAQSNLIKIDLSPVSSIYADTIRKIRRAGIEISDRRAVRLQRPIAASAMLCQRSQANVTDLWILRYVWDIQEQHPILESIVQSALETATSDEVLSAHPRSSDQSIPNPEEIQKSLAAIKDLYSNLGDQSPEAVRLHASQAKDQLAAVANRCQWISNQVQRQFLVDQIDAMWKDLQA